MIALVKFIHIAAIAVWAAGLVSIPTFHRQLGQLRTKRPGTPLPDEDVLQVQRAVRLTYVGIVSPAAFIAVASGIVLVFQRGIAMPWFSLKLSLVVGLVIAHTFAGLTLVRLFEQPAGYPVWRYVGATSSAVALATAIIALTLAKPELSGDFLPSAMHEPGALKRLVESINPWQRP